MMLGDHLLDGRKNLALKGLTLSLDSDAREDCYISHAHSDHSGAAKKKGKRLLASDATLALLGKEERARVSLRDGEDVHLRLMNAGHMLGSTQLVAEWEGKKFVYTGDFRLSDGFTIKGASVEQCDYLLIESTYGSPHMRFPKREEVGGQIAKWVKKESKLNTVLLGGYSTGKAQELVALLNREGIVPLVHHRIEEVCSTYSRFGVRLMRIPLDSEEGEELKKRDFVCIMPFNLVKRELARSFSGLSGRGVATALATGWASTFQYHVDNVFPFSDHSDFGEILAYVERAAPKKIWCCYGSDKELAGALRARGYDASPLGEAGQQKLCVKV